MFSGVGSAWQPSLLVMFSGMWRLQGTGKCHQAPAEPCSQGTLGLFMACGTDVAPLPFAVSRSSHQPQGVCAPGREINLEGLEASDPDERDHAPVSPFLLSLDASFWGIVVRWNRTFGMAVLLLREQMNL